MFDDMGYQRTVSPGLYMDRGGEPINWPSNKAKLWNGKLIGKLLLIMTMANPERFTPKSKPVIYTGVFVKLYN